MPVVTIVAPPHPKTRVLLTTVADAIAAALGLGRGDVIAVSIAATATAVSGGGPDEPWPLVTIHGSDRGAAAIAVARDAAVAAVADWGRAHAITIGGVWCEWVLPLPR